MQTVCPLFSGIGIKTNGNLASTVKQYWAKFPCVLQSGKYPSPASGISSAINSVSQPPYSLEAFVSVVMGTTCGDS
jgi:hypothetical protein